MFFGLLNVDDLGIIGVGIGRRVYSCDITSVIAMFSVCSCELHFERTHTQLSKHQTKPV